MHPSFGEMLHTPPEQRRRYYQLLRSLTPAQRAQKLSGLCQAVRAMARAGVRARNPGAPPAEIDRELVTLLYGPQAAARLFRSP